MSTGVANDRPWASPTIAVLSPTTSPRTSTSGPPEFPGLMATSVWMKFAYRGAPGGRS